MEKAMGQTKRITYKRQLPRPWIRKSGSYTLPFDQYLPSATPLWTSSLRLGLLDVFDSLLLSENEWVALPAISPQGLVLPLHKKHVHFDFYHLEGCFRVDVGRLEGLLKRGGCKVLFFIHYFGNYNAQIVEVKQLCKRYGVLLVEDFVHGLFGKDDKGNPLGVTGDISICSLPKFLPVPDGAMIFINNPSVEIRFHCKRNVLWSLSIFFHTQSLLLNQWLQNHIDSVLYKPIKILSKVNYAVYYRLLCAISSNHQVSAKTVRILSHIDVEVFVQNRLAAFERWNQQYGLYEQAFVAPGYPVVDMNRNVTNIRKQLREEGIDTLSYIKGWQYIPDDPSFDYERQLQKSHYLLPLV